MNKSVCPICHREQADGLVCHECIQPLRRDLRSLPAYMAELQTTYTRQSGRSQSGGKGGETALAYDFNASLARETATITLASWIEDLQLGDFNVRTHVPCSCRPPQEPCQLIVVTPVPNNIRAWCAWLDQRINRIRNHPRAEKLIAEIRFSVHQVRQAIDRTGDSIFCGTCDICGAFLYAPLDAAEVVCRKCAWLDVESKYPVASRRTGLLAEAEKRLATRDQILKILPSGYGVPINASTFRSWVNRGRIVAQTHGPDGEPITDGKKYYILGEALALARAVVLSPDQGKETLAG